MLGFLPTRAYRPGTPGTTTFLSPYQEPSTTVGTASQWTRTPLSGPGRAFLIWSVLALPLGALTWAWIRRLALRRLPLDPRLLVLILALWLVVAAVTASAVGAEWELDGVILRNPLQRMAGVGLRWLPGVSGLVLSIAGLAVTLEARYRLTHPDAPAPPEVSPTGP